MVVGLIDKVFPYFIILYAQSFVTKVHSVCRKSVKAIQIILHQAYSIFRNVLLRRKFSVHKLSIYLLRTKQYRLFFLLYFSLIHTRHIGLYNEYHQAFLPVLLLSLMAHD
nr:MAG TPA: hypothetical protein [Caudoviricetes sp.]